MARSVVHFPKPIGGCALFVLAGVLASWPENASAESVRVTSAVAHVMAARNDGTNVIATVPAGTMLEVIARQEEWCLVTLPDEATGRKREGWIRAAAVARVDGSLPIAAADSSVPPDGQPIPARDVPVPSPHVPWHVMHEGVAFGTLNHQGGNRGGTDFRSQNWWMTMASRPLGPGTLTLTGMLSLEPATIRPQGYREIFQAGETYKHLPLVDHQHPHDLLMQAAAIWRVPLNDRLAVTIAGAPVGEAALGPVAFMHRASAAENPSAPLSHHTFDSTHIAMGVVTGGVDSGPFALEGSIFRGREPDENRWNLMDPGKLDSYSARVWYKPGEFQFQASYGFLKDPEAPIEIQDVRRSTASVSWLHRWPSGFTAATAMLGHNKRRFSDSGAFLLEATHRFSQNTVYGRYEWIEVETEHLLFPGFIHKPHPGELIDPLQALTLGGTRDIAKIAGAELAVGGDVVFYKVPGRLEFNYGERPTSFHIFFRVRPPASMMGRMWNMVMSQPRH